MARIATSFTNVMVPANDRFCDDAECRTADAGFRPSPLTLEMTLAKISAEMMDEAIARSARRTKV